MPTTQSLVHVTAEKANILSAAIKTAGLQKMLEGTDILTVFAPSDTAFAAMQKEMDYLLQPGHIAKLTKVLAYHIVKGKHRISDLKDNEELITVSGKKLTIQIKSGSITVNGVLLTVADIDASNGVLHIIDEVLFPANNTPVVKDKENNTFTGTGEFKGSIKKK